MTDKVTTEKFNTNESIIMTNNISYIEFPAKNLPATKAFFQQVFQWDFQDFGPEYTAFSDQGLAGGFFKSELSSSTKTGGVLVVLSSDDLETSEAEVIERCCSSRHDQISSNQNNIYDC